MALPQQNDLATLQKTLIGGANVPYQQGLATLQQILASQGATDPRFLARETLGIARAGEGREQAAEAGMAESGIVSPAQQAILAAIRSGTAGQVSGAQAREAALTEERKRMDLSNLLTSVLGPAFGAASQAQQFEFQKRLASQPDTLAQLASLAETAGRAYMAYQTGGASEAAAGAGR